MPPRRIVDQLNDEPELDQETEETIETDAEEIEASAEDETEAEDEQTEQVEDDAEEGEEPEPQPRRRAPSRSESTIANLRRRAQEAERRARELELARNNRTTEPAPESEAIRNARLATMDPNERVEFLLNEERAERRRERAMDNFRHQDERDRTTFEALVAREPTLKKYADEVEHRLMLLRTQGQNAPRESVLKFILGERVIAGRTSPKAKAQRAAADKRVERQQVTLPKGKGEKGSRTGSKSADLEKRLMNVPI